MSITTQFEDEKELIEPALRKFLYEIGSADIRRRIPQVELSEEEVEAELKEIRRVKKECATTYSPWAAARTPWTPKE